MYKDLNYYEYNKIASNLNTLVSCNKLSLFKNNKKKFSPLKNGTMSSSNILSLFKLLNFKYTSLFEKIIPDFRNYLKDSMNHLVKDIDFNKITTENLQNILISYTTSYYINKNLDIDLQFEILNYVTGLLGLSSSVKGDIMELASVYIDVVTNIITEEEIPDSEYIEESNVPGEEYLINIINGICNSLNIESHYVYHSSIVDFLVQNEIDTESSNDSNFIESIYFGELIKEYIQSIPTIKETYDEYYFIFEDFFGHEDGLTYYFDIKLSDEFLNILNSVLNCTPSSEGIRLEAYHYCNKLKLQIPVGYMYCGNPIGLIVVISIILKLSKEIK